MNRDELIRDQRAFQSWRPESETAFLVDYMAARDIPYCEACHDWHAPDEVHSTFDGWETR
jgi:hypothetical protein